MTPGKKAYYKSLWCTQKKALCCNLQKGQEGKSLQHRLPQARCLNQPHCHPLPAAAEGRFKELLPSIHLEYSMRGTMTSQVQSIENTIE
jgi:hypothetical protein